MSEAIKKAVRKGVHVNSRMPGYGHTVTVNVLGAIYVGRFGLGADHANSHIETDPHVITRRLRDAYPQLEVRGRGTVGLGQALKAVGYTDKDWEKQSLLRTLAKLNEADAVRVLEAVRL